MCIWFCLRFGFGFVLFFLAQWSVRFFKSNPYIETNVLYMIYWGVWLGLLWSSLVYAPTLTSFLQFRPIKLPEILGFSFGIYYPNQSVHLQIWIKSWYVVTSGYICPKFLFDHEIYPLSFTTVWCGLKWLAYGLGIQSKLEFVAVCPIVTRHI